MPADPVIRVRCLQRSFEVGPTVVHALRGVDLVVDAGEFVAVMGPSGAGKSTLLNQLGALDRPTSGSYELCGLDLAAADSTERARLRGAHIGFVFQHFHLLAHQTVAENVALARRTVDPTDERDLGRRVHDALDRVGVGHLVGATPDQLSGGERQRVAIARALVNGPALLLCDEPTGNLDRASSRHVLDLLRRLADEGDTVVVVTHDPEVGATADRVVEIVDGRVTSDRRRAAARPPTVRAPRPGSGAQLPPVPRSRRVRRCLADATSSLASRPGRFTSLALGVAIGCASLVASGGIAAGSSLKVYGQFDRLAGTRAEATTALGADPVGPAEVDARTAAVRRLNGVTAAAALVRGSGTEAVVTTRVGALSAPTAPVVGGSARLAELTGGRLLGDPDAVAAALARPGDSVVLGSFLAERLDPDPASLIGRRVLVDGHPLRVLGILDEPEVHPELESAAIVPIARLAAHVRPDRLTVLTRTQLGAVRSVGEELPWALDPARPDAVEVARASDPQQLRADVGSSLRVLMVSIGGLSMLLGAFGITNALAAAVAQRSGEIGLRRALGATARSVSTLFLVEAALLGAFGGLVGAAAGAVVTWVVSRVGQFPTAVDPATMLAAPLAGIAIGALAGIVPARRAAAVAPADALRSGV